MESQILQTIVSTMRQQNNANEDFISSLEGKASRMGLSDGKLKNTGSQVQEGPSQERVQAEPPLLEQISIEQKRGHELSDRLQSVNSLFDRLI